MNKKCSILIRWETLEQMPDGRLSPGNISEKELLVFNVISDDDCREKIKKCLETIKQIFTTT